MSPAEEVATTLLRDYGWTGVLIWLVADRIVPTIRDHVLPERVKQKNFERQHLEQLEERQVKAFEKTAEAVSELSKCYLVANERLTHIEGYMEALMGREKRKATVKKPT